MHATPTGVLYFVHGNDLYRIDTTGAVQLMARQVAQQTATFSQMSGRHDLFGIWTDKKENVYVANFSGQVVRKYDQTAVSTMQYILPRPGRLPVAFLMRRVIYGFWKLPLRMKVRVRKVFKKEIARQNKTGPYMVNNSVPVLLMVLFLVVAVACIVWVVKKRNRVTMVAHQK